MNAIQKQPVVFVGHGAPTLALEKEGLAKALHSMANFTAPKVIIAVSAHWETEGTQVLHLDKPKTIHDFYGFRELAGFAYEAPSSLAFAEQLAKELPAAKLSKNWGYDHGVWTVLCHLFPAANIPIVPVSISKNLSYQEHYQLGELLSKYREQGAMIFCSGNIVHNLRAMDHSGDVYSWAKDFDQTITQYILQRQSENLLNFEALGCKAELSVPTAEHFIPMLYAAGAADPKDKIKLIYEGFQFGSISQKSFLFG